MSARPVRLLWLALIASSCREPPASAPDLHIPSARPAAAVVTPAPPKAASPKAPPDGGAPGPPDPAERCLGRIEVLYCQGEGYDRCSLEAERGRPCRRQEDCRTRCQARPPRSTSGGNWCRRLTERRYRCDALVGRSRPPDRSPRGGPLSR